MWGGGGRGGGEEKEEKEDEKEAEEEIVLHTRRSVECLLGGSRVGGVADQHIKKL